VPGIHENVIAPQSVNYFLARHQPALFFHKKNQKLHTIFFELDDTIATTQLVATQVQMKFFEVDDLSRQTSPNIGPGSMSPSKEPVNP
jgi:hypothetical protein